MSPKPKTSKLKACVSPRHKGMLKILMH
uniref:Uncharacterized protein n=1 Tax=Rhizophora mucronata TaxID=61149 RepID=A0A2P2PA75_RHIMU